MAGSIFDRVLEDDGSDDIVHLRAQLADARKLLIDKKVVEEQLELERSKVEVLERNISCLFTTAQLEIRRKDTEIRRLRMVLRAGLHATNSLRRELAEIKNEPVPPALEHPMTPPPGHSGGAPSRSNWAKGEAGAGAAHGDRSHQQHLRPSRGGGFAGRGSGRGGGAGGARGRGHRPRGDTGRGRGGERGRDAGAPSQGGGLQLLGAPTRRRDGPPSQAATAVSRPSSSSSSGLGGVPSGGYRGHGPSSHHGRPDHMHRQGQTYGQTYGQASDAHSGRDSRPAAGGGGHPGGGGHQPQHGHYGHPSHASQPHGHIPPQGSHGQGAHGQGAHGYGQLSAGHPHGGGGSLLGGGASAGGSSQADPRGYSRGGDPRQAAGGGFDPRSAPQDGAPRHAHGDPRAAARDPRLG